MSLHYLAMLLDIFLFVLLGSYLDQVLPSEFGIRKHPLFCLRKKVDLRDRENVRVQQYSSPNFEQISNAMRLQDQHNDSIRVQNLTL